MHFRNLSPETRSLSLTTPPGGAHIHMPCDHSNQHPGRDADGSHFSDDPTEQIPGVDAAPHPGSWGIATGLAVQS
eukprot:6824070-Prymnesium_polylepis.1